MKIGIDASRANKPNRTGTEWYSYYLIQALAQIDSQNQYELYISQEPAKDLQNLPSNFHLKVLNWPPRKLWSQIRLSAEIVRYKPDVLFVPAHTLPFISPKNTVTTVHDIGFKTHPHLYNPKERNYQEWSLRRALKKTRTIIAVSNFTKNELIKHYGVSEQQIKVVHHGYNKEIFKPVDVQQATEKARQYNLKPDNYLIYIGRLEKKKNTEGLIKAFEKLENKTLQLALIGSGDIQTNNPRIKKLGWVPLIDLPHLITASQAFVFPTFYEGFGLPILEAMACNKLIFASDIQPIREIIGNNVIFFDPNSPEDIAAKLKEHLPNRHKIAQELKSGWQATTNKFSWEKCAQETLAILTKL